MHSERNSISRSRLATLALSAAVFALAGCTNQYRPVVSSINPVGPAGQPQKFATVISSNGVNTPGLVNIIDFAGSAVLDTTSIGVNPKYLVLDTGSEAYTLNGDGTLNSFTVSTSLLKANVNTSSLPAGANPVALLPVSANLYLTETGLNSIAQLTGAPPAVRQQLPTGANTVYTVGNTGVARVYGLVQGSGTAAGSALAIETANNTVSSTIPVGIRPIYGVMTPDGRRAFILNNGSNTVSVINAQTNAPDTFTSNGVATGTIPVGVAPIWADFAPTLSEVLVASAGNGVTPGTVSIISIPLCSQTSVATNPNCDPNNPVDASGFGQVVATVQVGINPVVIGVLQDGTQAYVANAGNAAANIPGSVSVINLTSNTVTNTIPAGNSTITSDALIHGHPNFLAVTTGTPTGRVYITAGDSTDLTIIRTDTNTVESHVPLQGQGVMVRVTAP